MQIILTDHVQMVNKPAHISGSLIDFVYIKKALTEEFFTYVTFIFQILMLLEL